MSDTKALENVVAFAKRHGGHDIPLQYALEAAAELAQLRAENAEMREALEEIKSARGAYSMDALTHASNVIEHHTEIAASVLSKYPKDGKK